ncbi:unnamed protein product [Heterobilharzia americana]|nr:unnamed protein product [Heterobilharzia americana]
MFMEKLKSGPLRNTINKLSYCRCMDDISFCTKNNTNPNILLDTFSSVHPETKFTCETEKDGCLPFLAVLPSRRTGDSTRRSIYHKESWVGQYIHFRSFVPLIYKRNLIRTLMFRVSKIFTADTLKDELRIIEKSFYKNRYPEKFLNTVTIKTAEEKHLQMVPKKRLYLTVEFKGDTDVETHTETQISDTKKSFAATLFEICYSLFNANAI